MQSFNLKQYLSTLLLFTVIQAAGQTYNISISNENACLEQVVCSDILVTDFNNIGAITLFIDFPEDSIQFDSISNLSPYLNGLIYNNIMDSSNQAIGKIGISWSGFNPIFMGSGLLFKLCFTYKGFETNISFSANCEIADYDANILGFSYINGLISPTSLTQITQQPEDSLQIESGQSFILQVQAINVDSFQWQVYEDDLWIDIIENSQFLGVNTSILQVLNFSPMTTHTRFRCIVTGCTKDITNESLVISSLNVSLLSKTHAYIYPNPTSDLLNIPMHIGQNQIQLMDFQMNVISLINIHTHSYDHQSIDLSNFPNGIYIIQVNNKENNYQFSSRFVVQH